MKFKDALQKELYYRAQIDYYYWLLHEIAEPKDEAKSPIEALIDEATGYNEAKVKQNIKHVKDMVKSIIKWKEKIDCDTEPDKKLLEKLKTL